MKIYEYLVKIRESGADKIVKISKASGTAENNVNRLNGAFSGLKRTVAGLALGAALFTAAKASATLGIEMEQTRVSFTTFLKDADKANETISQLNEFSNVTPFDNAQVIQAGKSLLAFGTDAKQLEPTLRKIGDISAGTGKDFNELATIFGKARIAGTLYAEDINQLVEAGVPIMGEFAKALGTTEDKVKKMASEGKLKFKDLEQAFTNLTSEGGLFFDLMDKQSQTVGGKISTFQGKMQSLGIGVGEAFNPVFGKVFDKLIGQVDKNKDQIIAWSKVAAGHVMKFAQAAMPPIRAVIGGFKSMVTWMQENQTTLEVLGYAVGIAGAAYLGYQAVLFAATIPMKIQAVWTSILTAKQWLLNAALTANPIGLIVAGIAALVAVVAIAVKKYNEWGAALMLLTPGLGQVVNLIQSFRRHWDSIKQAFTDGGIVAGLKRIGLVMLDSILMPLQQLLELASKLPGKMGLMADTGARGIENLRKKLELLPDKVKLSTTLSVGKDGGLIGDLLGDDSAGGDSSAEAIDSNLKQGINSINGGGTKHTNITISVETMQAAETITISSADEGIEDIEEKVQEALLRVLNSANEIATQ